MDAPRRHTICHQPRWNPVPKPVAIGPQIFPPFLRLRRGLSRRIQRGLLRLHPTAEARQVLPGKSVQAALFQHQLDEAAESPWTFPTAPYPFSEAVAAEAQARPVLPGPEQGFRPL